jgi:DNA polymerase-3 subunit epsilon
MRQIVLDTETTGLETSEGHRIIEIGCVELVDRRLTGNNYHQYLQPDREIAQGAFEVHGIDNDFLADKPRFGDIAADLLEYLRGAELIIHNAPFDVGFLDYELGLLGARWGPIAQHCAILDTLQLARQLHPGQKNSLDALCRRYGIDNSQRTLHGALLDAEILADVYLAITGGQVSLLLGGGVNEPSRADYSVEIERLSPERPALPIFRVSAEDAEAHRRCLEHIERVSGGRCLWSSGEGVAQDP